MEDSGFLQSLLDLVAQHHGWGAVVLFLSSLIEYVFPPFPGDMVTLFGTFLVVRGLWSFPFALLLTTGGSLLGATADYGLGLWLSKRLDRLPSEKTVKRWRPLTIEKYHLITERFQRHGALYICLNRFLPGIRAFFFVVAGAARMPLWKVLLYAGVSACLWNALILGAGLLVGENWDRLQSWFQSYSIVMWSLIGVVVVAGFVFWLVRIRRRAS
jgi:membrane protein DedA with SNARE-associated domain